MPTIMKDHFAVVIKDGPDFNVVYRSLNKERAIEDYKDRSSSDPKNAYLFMEYHDGKYSQVEVK